MVERANSLVHVLCCAPRAYNQREMMPREPNTRLITERQRIWSVLASAADSFVQAWEAAPPEPELHSYLPDEAAPDSARRLVLVELIKIDLAYRSRDPGRARRLDEYLQRWPELVSAEGTPPVDLVYEEWQLRRRAGEPVTAAEYAHQFPRLAEPLERMTTSGVTVSTRSVIRPAQVARFQPGQTIDDFDLLTSLGQGAFAQVFLARQHSMQRLVALKISSNEGLEPQTLAQLDHPNIVRVFDQRLLPDRGLRLLYMQYVAGGTLADALARVHQSARPSWSGRRLVEAIDQSVVERGESPAYDAPARQAILALSWPEVVARLGSQLAMALDYAHQRGVLHRDLKPANVLLSPDGTARLADFNVSFCAHVSGASPAAYFGGSLAYMSPEQLETASPHYQRTADQLGPESDLYSLGVVLFEMLFGRRPFEWPAVGDDWTEQVAALINQRRVGLTPQRRREALADCPSALRQAIEKCLQPEIADRWRSAGQLTQILHWAADGEARALVDAAQRPRPRIVDLVTWPVLIAALIPNALAGMFIYAYNLDASLASDPHQTFWYVQAAINAIAFPLGMFLMTAAARPVRRAMIATGVVGERPTGPGAASTPPAAAESAAMGLRRVTMLGHMVALITLAEWSVAGILYPLILTGARVELAATGWSDFIASHVLAGAAAAAYLFFLVTWLAVRRWYPRLLLGALELAPLADQSDRLDRLQRLVTLYQAVSALIPTAAVALLVILRATENRFALGVLSLVGVFGFGLVFWMAREINRAIGVLRRMTARPTTAM